MPGIYFMTLKNLSIIVKRSNIWSGICIFKYFHVSQAQYYLVLFILTTNWSISIIWPGFKIRWTAEFARQKFFKRLIFIFYLILAKTKYKSTLRYKYISGKIRRDWKIGIICNCSSPHVILRISILIRGLKYLHTFLYNIKYFINNRR